ncbi:phBC6A51 family helix-turn-helix protein [Laceyella tengchongensis]
MRTDYKRMRELEQIIRPDKLQACLRYYEEMSKPKGQRKSHKELAEEFGITEMTWWRWRQDPEFIEYLGLLSSRTVDASLPVATNALLRMIDTTQPSSKALEMYFKLLGMLNEKHTVETRDLSAEITEDAIKKQIEVLKAELKGEDTKE